jgi:hypothetical protein
VRDNRSRRGAVVLFCLCGPLLLVRCVPRGAVPIPADSPVVDRPFLRCGAAGEACCQPPGGAHSSPSLGPLVSCQTGLGCDVTTLTCVSPCGGNGQVCCDGPETRAVKWTAKGQPYSRTDQWNLRDMCAGGACDKQTHRCFACGLDDGAPCCPPDAAQATPRCVGDRLECKDSGLCEGCGFRGRPRCPWGCEPGLGIRNNLCDACGADGQPPCDVGRCNGDLGVLQGVCRPCGKNQQVPCDQGCRSGLGPRNGFCVPCGNDGQGPCETGCRPFTRLMADGTCRFCGNVGQPPCEWGCVYKAGVRGGVCRTCGALGEMPCDTGCHVGLMASADDHCVKPPNAPPAQPCATAGQSCVADWLSGPHCCTTGGPLLCVYQTCKPCVPHGQECVPGGPQVCCNARFGEMCVFDFTEDKIVCEIPDAPGQD